MSLQVGDVAPEFNLRNANTAFGNEQQSLSDSMAKNGCVVVFECNHCPYVKHINETIVEIANKFTHEGVNFIAISSNDVINYPEDSPELMKLNAKQNKFSFPYLYDESQEVAKKYFVKKVK